MNLEVVCVLSREVGSGIYLARVVSIETPFSEIPLGTWLSPARLVGSQITLDLAQTRMAKNVLLRVGFLVRAEISSSVAQLAIEEISKESGMEILVKPNSLLPVNEPCVRVPLSLLSDLRGQEEMGEAGRRALIKTWREDRKTGDHK